MTLSSHLGARGDTSRRTRRVPAQELVMMSLLFRFARDRSGATAIEYGLIAAGIAAVIILAVNSLGTNVNGKLVDINTNLK